MTHFTFDTAYIVAHLQNDANERVKAGIRQRLGIPPGMSLRAMADEAEQARDRFESHEAYLTRRGWSCFEADCAITRPDRWQDIVDYIPF